MLTWQEDESPSSEDLQELQGLQSVKKDTLLG